LQFEHDLVKTNGVRLHVVMAGPQDGPLVILLHGFPEFWLCWEAQIAFLAAQGYRVWAPDQRGYNMSSKPRRIAAYNLDELVDDLIGLIDAAGRERAFLAAHDWGAGVAWWAARLFPERFEKMVILNGPHGSVMEQHLTENRSQLLKSWYMLFFQLPWLPEFGMRFGNWDGLINGLKSSNHPMAVNQDNEKLDAYRMAWSQPGAMTAMVNWYRAAARERPTRKASPKVQVPTLIIWGTEDNFLGRELAEPSAALCVDEQLVFIEGASHWVQQDSAEKVNWLMKDFFDDSREDFEAFLAPVPDTEPIDEDRLEI
jgi:pimeloyl-ACP methyl ester carboxylesterase